MNLGIKIPQKGDWILIGIGSIEISDNNRDIVSLQFINYASFRDHIETNKPLLSTDFTRYLIDFKLLHLVEIGTVYFEDGTIRRNYDFAISYIEKQKQNLPRNFAAFRVEIENPQNYNYLKFSDIISSELPDYQFDIKSQPYRYLNFSYAIKIPKKDIGYDFPIIISCAEIARFFFLKGQKLSENLLNEKLTCYLSSLLTPETRNGKRIAEFVIEEGYFDSEILCIAQLLYQKYFAYSFKTLVSNRNNDLYRYQPKKYWNLKTKIPVSSAITLEVSGYHITNSPTSPFVVCQIHAASYSWAFDDVLYLALSDKSSIRDKSQIEDLSAISYQKKCSYNKVGSPKTICSNSKASIGSLSRYFEKESKGLGLIHSNIPQVHRREKEKQYNQYHSSQIILDQSVYMQYSNLGRDNVSTTTGHCKTARKDLDFSPVCNWNGLEYIKKIASNLSNKDGWKVVYFDDRSKTFSNTWHYIANNEMQLCIVGIQIQEKLCFYLFESYFMELGFVRLTTMFYRSNFQPLKLYHVELLIDKTLLCKANFGKTPPIGLVPHLKMKRFNHQNETFNDSTDKIETTILNLIKKEQ
ncbi:hypothetical protein [Paludibacter sp.]|uniref:hypothetical protein n=1 Tax=Paludibacter sp. TaxID=1898105 RepID=UPI0013532402|nr:hypothetical protein [Paludibacter sp.]MTK52133.1 hypothetical protein [Paludibacter sp.]